MNGRLSNSNLGYLVLFILFHASCSLSNPFSNEKQLASLQPVASGKPFLEQDFHPASAELCPLGGFVVDLKPEGNAPGQAALYQLLSCVTEVVPREEEHVPPSQLSLNRPWGDCKFEDLKVANSPVWKFNLSKNSWELQSRRDEMPPPAVESLKINLQDFAEVDFLTNLENLKYLMITGLPKDGRLKLPELPGIEYLCVRNLGLKNLDWMASVPNLKLLDLRENQIENFSPLIELLGANPDFGLYSDLRVRGRTISFLK